MTSRVGVRTHVSAMKPSLISLIAVGALSAYAATSAPAADHGAASGRLEATGSGKVVLSGHVVAFGLVSGKRSRIIVSDRRGDATVTVNGRVRMRSTSRKRAKHRRVVIRNANGRFYVRGSWVTILVQGSRLNLAIAGNGRARLRGAGRFSLNDARARDWSRDPRRWRNLRLRPPVKR